MSAEAKPHPQILESFLQDYLPWGTSQEYHDLLTAILQAARKKIADELRERGELRAEDEGD